MALSQMLSAKLIGAIVALCMFARSEAGDFLAKRTRIMQMTEATAEVIFQDNALWRRPILVFFRPEASTRTREEDEVRAAVDQLDKRFFVVFSGDTTLTELKLMNTMGLFQGEELPLLGALSFDFHQDNPKADFHSFRFRGNITRQAVLEFSEDFLGGRLRPEGQLSEPLPPAESERDGGVQQLVGLNFDKVTKDPEKDTLVYWYADGCGWCAQFKKEYKRVAARLGHVKSLNFAWIDASRNGIAQPKRFPTVALFPAHGKQVPASKEVPFWNDAHLQAVEFMGDILKGEQTISAMIDWLHKEAAVPFEDTPPAPAEEEDQISMLAVDTNKDL
ncbi:unnamed protein product [Prorocentrum cordatum]|uniref:protein disulfide-isomerase n=1 Tax=Prorocentrum cordatum TaxID=2364126 RepID=A0ABN9V7P8_9DINO|nr:unnamed protein product [Polarella glacialis]|mmetsp:Transcript_95717/g.249345  ORF Transcript_95717/g.249345 Transcript_95717/m.249345 type:complete len:333 (+) Transcript_95717:86-1084(+)